LFPPGSEQPGRGSLPGTLNKIYFIIIAYNNKITRSIGIIKINVKIPSQKPLYGIF
jgi:hypothetical protein